MAFLLLHLLHFIIITVLVLIVAAPSFLMTCLFLSPKERAPLS